MGTGWDLMYQHGCVVMTRAVSRVPFSRREHEAFKRALFTSQVKDLLKTQGSGWALACRCPQLRHREQSIRQILLNQESSPGHQVRAIYNLGFCSSQSATPLSYTCRNCAPVAFSDWSVLGLATRTSGTVDTRSLQERSGGLTLEEKECVHEL